MLPVVNPGSEKIIDSLLLDLPGSILLTGPEGVGLGTISKFIAEKLNITPHITLPEKKEKIDLVDGKISVDSMRRLYDEVRVKLPGKRIFIIDYAERMTNQAQNAFLKLLEEPGDDVHYIIASHSTSKLLPTILSRIQTVQIRPITLHQSNILLDNKNVTEAVRRAQLLFMANGLPAELSRLLADENYFNEQVTIIRDAREMLTGTSYQKLIVVFKYKDSRVNSLKLLSYMLKILKKSIDDNPKIDNVSRLEALTTAYDDIALNGNIRIVLTRISV